MTLIESTQDMIARFRKERRERRKSDVIPCINHAAVEIQERVLEVLRLSEEDCARCRKFGFKGDSWFSVGLMTQELRQTGKGWTGEAFHRLLKRDQCSAVRKALESLWDQGKVKRAIGMDFGRECYQYQFGADE